MAYDLPFMSKSRRDIGKLPGEQSDPLLPSPMEPMTPMSTPDWASVRDSTPDWLRPDRGFRESIYKPPFDPSATLAVTAPETIPSAIPTPSVEPVDQAPVIPTIRELSPEVEQEPEPRRVFGRELPEDPPDPESPMVDIGISNNYAGAIDFRPEPGDLLHTGIPILDEGIGYAKGLGTFAGAWFEGPMFWPMQVAGLTAMEVVELQQKIKLRPWSVRSGDMPTVLTEGPRSAKSKFDKLPIWQQIVAEGVIPVTAVGMASRLLRSGNRATISSARASGANLSEREFIDSADIIQEAVPVELTDDAIDSATALDRAVLEEVQRKIDSGVELGMLNGNNIAGIRSDIPPGKSPEGTKKFMSRMLKRAQFDDPDDFDETLNPFYEHAKERRLAITSLANDFGAQVDYIVNRKLDDGSQLFPINDKGLIPSLGTDKYGNPIDITLPKGNFNYAPTLQDVAARLDKFAPHMSQEQINALEQVRSLLKPWKDLVDEVGLDITPRRDVTGRGFYIPRGDAKSIAEEMRYVEAHGGKRLEGVAEYGFEKEAQFASMAQGVSEDFEYAAVGPTIRSYVHNVGDQSVRKNLIDSIVRAHDESGRLFGETPGMRRERLYGAKHKELKNAQSRLRQRIQNSIFQSGIAKESDEVLKRDLKVSAGASARTIRSRQELEKYQVLAADRAKTVDLANEAEKIRADYGEEIRAITAELRVGGRNLTRLEQELVNKSRVLLTNVVDVGGIQKSSSEDLYRPTQAYFAAIERITQLHKNIDLLVETRDDLASKYDDLIERKEILKELRDEERVNLVQLRKESRAKDRAHMKAQIIDNEVRILEREEERALRQWAATRKHGADIAARRAKNAEEIEGLKELVDRKNASWRAIVKSTSTPETEGRDIIDIRGMEGYDFPQAMANAMNRAIKAEGGPVNRSKLAIGLERVAKPAVMVNRWFLGFKATGDDGVLMIQGMLGMAGTRGAGTGALGIGGRDFRSMMKWHIQAWGDERTLGAYMLDFNEKARKSGRLLTYQWERFGLRVGGANTEFSLLAPAEKVPVLGKFARASNRAFGYYGDSRRLAWADDMLEEELSKNRELPEILASGDLERIAEVANVMTGWSKRRTGGAIGELAFLAPRFLQARLETTWKAARGSVPAFSNGKMRIGSSIDQRMARRSMLRTIAHVAVITEMVNRMQGRETDWRPVLRGKDGKPRWNSNFMRMRVGYLNRDVSLMGTYDSLARLLVSLGTADFAVVRTLSSGTAQNMWDFISGRDWQGKYVRDNPENFAKRVLSNFMPMAAEDGAESLWKGIKSARDKDWDGVAEGVGGVFVEFLGAKSAPRSQLDIKQDAANEIIAKLSDQERKDLDQTIKTSGYNALSGQDYLYDYLPKYIRSKAEATEEYIDAENKLPPPNLGTVQQQLAVAIENFNKTKVTAMEELDQAIIGGMQGEELRLTIQKYGQEMKTANNVLFQGPVKEYLDSEGPKNLLDKYINLYWDVPLDYINPNTNQLNYAKQEEERAKIILDAREEIGIDLDESDFRQRVPTGNDRIDAVLAQRDRDLETLQSLWETGDELLTIYTPAEQDLWKRYTQLEGTAAQDFYTRNEIIRIITKDLRDLRIFMRENDGDIDVAYIRQGYSKASRSILGEIQLLQMVERGYKNELEVREGAPIAPLIPAEEPENIETVEQPLR